MSSYVQQLIGLKDGHGNAYIYKMIDWNTSKLEAVFYCLGSMFVIGLLHVFLVWIKKIFLNRTCCLCSTPDTTPDTTPLLEQV